MQYGLISLDYAKTIFTHTGVGIQYQYQYHITLRLYKYPSIGVVQYKLFQFLTAHCVLDCEMRATFIPFSLV